MIMKLNFPSLGDLEVRSLRLVDSFTPKQWVASVCFPVGPSSPSCLSLIHFKNPTWQQQRLRACATKQAASDKHLQTLSLSSKAAFG